MPQMSGKGIVHRHGGCGGWLPEVSRKLPAEDGAWHETEAQWLSPARGLDGDICPTPISTGIVPNSASSRLRR
jgi:hypothetical protein